MAKNISITYYKTLTWHYYLTLEAEKTWIIVNIKSWKKMQVFFLKSAKFRGVKILKNNPLHLKTKK